MEREKINRLNELAAKAKKESLSAEELQERDLLRKEYIAACKADFANTQNNTYVVDKRGHKRKLVHKEKEKNKKAD